MDSNNTTNHESPFTTLIPFPAEPTLDDVLDTYIGTLGNVDLSVELLKKQFPTYNKLKFIRSLGSNQGALQEAIRTFALLESAALKTKMAVLLEEEMLHLSPADLAKNYIALQQTIMEATRPNPNAPGVVNNTQINFAQTIRDNLPPHVQEALRVLMEPDGE